MFFNVARLNRIAAGTSIKLLFIKTTSAASMAISCNNGSDPVLPDETEKESESSAEHYENSYIGRIGHLCEPIFEPLGLNWKSSVSLLSGVAAKEIMVSTLGVLYSEDNNENSAEQSPTQLRNRLLESGDFTPPSALALLVFVFVLLDIL